MVTTSHLLGAGNLNLIILIGEYKLLVLETIHKYILYREVGTDMCFVRNFVCKKILMQSYVTYCSGNFIRFLSALYTVHALISIK